MLLLLVASQLAQCSSAARRAEPEAVSTPAARVEAPREPEGERKPRDAKERAREEQDEESARIKSVAHALQTIGANPELRKTYGFRE